MIKICLIKNQIKNISNPREFYLFIILIFLGSILTSCDSKKNDSLLEAKYRATYLNRSCVGPGVTDGSEYFLSNGSGIINGSRLTSNSRFSNRLVIVSNQLNYKNDFQSICTGILMPQNVILTAGHCVSRTLKTMKVTFPSYRDCSGNRSISQDKTFKVDRVIIHPTYNRDDPDSKGNGIHSILKNFNFDMALIRLKGIAPSEYQPLPLPDSNLDLSFVKQFILMGFGKDEKGELGELKMTHLTQENLQDYDLNSPSMYFHQRYRGICSGDSGGPVLAVKNNNIVLVGISSSVVKKKESSDGEFCQQGAVFVSTSYYSDWIKEAHQEITL